MWTGQAGTCLDQPRTCLRRTAAVMLAEGMTSGKCQKHREETLAWDPVSEKWSPRTPWKMVCSPGSGSLGKSGLALPGVHCWKSRGGVFVVEGQWPIVGSVPPFLTQFIQQILRDSLCPVPGTVAGGGFTHMKEQVQPQASWRCSSSQENTISPSLPSGTDADTRDGPAVSADTI